MNRSLALAILICFFISLASAKRPAPVVQQTPALAVLNSAEMQERTTRKKPVPKRSTNSSQEIRKLNARLAGMKSSQDSLISRVRRLEAQLQLVNSVLPELQAALKAAVAANAAMDSSELALVNQLSLIVNKINLLEDKAVYVDSTNFEILSQMVLIENKIVSLANSFNDIMAARSSINTDTPSELSDEEFRRSYIAALTAYQNGQFREASNQFIELLKSGKTHELADNSQYWLAECFYDLKNYRRAITEFEKVARFPNSDKQDDAQYKIGLCYLNAGNPDQARAEFSKLIEKFPKSDLREKARRYLQ